MAMTGKMDAGGKKSVQLPFVMKLKRPRMSRVEITFQEKTAVQVYDGRNGWKVRPFLGRSEVEPYTREETESAADQQELDGPLIDHEAKGIRVELAALEQVEGRDAYKLRLTNGDGHKRHVWVDAQSFLEAKIEGSPRKLNGRMHKVEVFYRNYTPVRGLMIPFVLETVVEKARPSRKITIETVELNPPLEEGTFAKPELPGVAARSSASLPAPAVPVAKGASSEKR
jgi:hypothetical protein